MVVTAKRLKIYFDGGCRPNPGAIEAAVVVRGVAQISTDLGQGTNCDAEWRALILALKAAQTSGAGDFVLLGDSAIVVAQARRERPCRTAMLQQHFDEFLAIVGAGRWPRVRKIARAQNLAGIALAKLHAR